MRLNFIGAFGSQCCTDIKIKFTIRELKSTEQTCTSVNIFRTNQEIFSGSDYMFHVIPGGIIAIGYEYCFVFKEPLSHCPHSFLFVPMSSSLNDKIHISVIENVISSVDMKLVYTLDIGTF